ncbi:hypothetical protein [Clostridium frigidicarnis]|uniref:Uncharacterized protein n=1 Tax=Clostridium frigidicarnis TaxID=84698 RepID=A0A1I1B7U4_9CLOT|nr:hypothetical protein [Clostridium frigidicarnis]SFB45736.1 hypothetical protein SAMN04488528_10692 [Clostridium frigidicarnis]
MKKNKKHSCKFMTLGMCWGPAIAVGMNQISTMYLFIIIGMIIGLFLDYLIYYKNKKSKM